MKVTMEMTGLEDVLTEVEMDMARGVQTAMVKGADLLKSDLRDGVVGAGLGERLARTWRSRVYPAGEPSLDAAAWVWSKAPKLVDVFDRGATIVPTAGKRHLAIPTRFVPRKGRRRMTPREVEARFGRLIVRKDTQGQTLMFVEAIAGANGRGLRKVTRRRTAQARTAKLILMFVLVPMVRLSKRLDINAAADRAASRTVGLMAQNWRG